MRYTYKIHFDNGVCVCSLYIVVFNFTLKQLE